MNIRQMNNTSQMQAAEMGFLWSVHVMTLRDNSAQLWNSQSPECRAASPNREISPSLVQPRL